MKDSFPRKSIHRIRMIRTGNEMHWSWVSFWAWDEHFNKGSINLL